MVADDYPYRHLLKAVFDAACRDYVQLVDRDYDGRSGKPAAASHLASIHDEARDWFLADTGDSDYPFTLHNVCAVLGWDERTIRRSIQRWESGELKEWENNRESN